MRIEPTNADCFTIYDAEGLAPITVVIQDQGGCGRLIIECYGAAWAAYFGAIGSQSLRDFLAGCHAGYVANRLASKGGDYVSAVAAAVISALRVG